MIAYTKIRNDCPFNKKDEWSLTMEAYQLDCQAFDSKNALENAIREQWYDKGLIVLINTQSQQLGDLQQWGNIIFQNLTTNSNDTKSDLQTDKEAGYLTYAPRCSVIRSVTQQQREGVTRIANNQQATLHLLAIPLGQKLAKKGIAYIRQMNDKMAVEMSSHNTSWQDTFFTYSRAQVEHYVTTQGWNYKWLDNGVLQTSYIVDAYQYDERLNNTPYFTGLNSQTTFFEQWHPFDTLANKEYPLNITLGDGSLFTKEEIRQLYGAYDLASLTLTWQQADLAILDNLRWIYDCPKLTLQSEAMIMSITMGMMNEQSVAVFS
ncbi:MAG TPA: hypothetical protein ENJ33_03185 [Thiothrix sp.]|nr:hypothetical protein [Thiothrix sp.]